MYRRSSGGGAVIVPKGDRQLSGENRTGGSRPLSVTQLAA
jgi:hypothetical protein